MRPTLSFLALACLLACRGPESALAPPPAPAAPAAPRPDPPQGLRIQVDTAPEVGVADPVAAELQAELLEAFKAWEARPAADPGPAKGPLLRVRVTRYKPEPAGSPFTFIAVPGIAATGVGVAVASAAAATDVFPIEIILGAGLGGVGIAAIIVGSILGRQQTVHDLQRGYPLHSLRAEARLEQPLGREPAWKENYRSLSLRKAARPLSPEEAKDPARVRRETLRALARCIQEDAEQALLK